MSGSDVNQTFLDELSSRLEGVVVLEEAHLLEERLVCARRKGLHRDAAWCCARIGDLRFMSAGPGDAERWYQQGRRADSFALGPLIGLAQVAAVKGQANTFEGLVSSMSTQLPRSADPEELIRAEAMIACSHVGGGGEGAAIERLIASGRFSAAWHLAHISAWKGEAKDPPPLSLAAHSAVRALARRYHLKQAELWSSVQMIRFLRGMERPAEAEAVLAEAIEVATLLGQPAPLDQLLAMGCDSAAELGHVAHLIERLRLRASIAKGQGHEMSGVRHLYQAFRVAFRAQRREATSLALELTEHAMSLERPPLDEESFASICDALEALECHEQGVHLSLYLSRFAFSQGARVDSARHLAKAARFSVRAGKLERGREMYNEAIEISQVFGLGVHDGWLSERDILSFD